MSEKKSAALDALHNLHFAERADSDVLETLFDALEEVAAERHAKQMLEGTPMAPEHPDEPIVPAIESEPPEKDA